MPGCPWKPAGQKGKRAGKICPYMECSSVSQNEKQEKMSGIDGAIRMHE